MSRHPNALNNDPAFRAWARRKDRNDEVARNAKPQRIVRRGVVFYWSPAVGRYVTVPE